MKITLHALLATTVVVHAAFTIGVVCAFFVLPFKQPWEVWVPLEVLIVSLTFGRHECPVTRLENYYRRRLGYKPIGGFVGHYFKRPVWKALGIKRMPKEEQPAS